MTDKFSIIDLPQLLRIILNQLDIKRQFFGIPEEVFFQPRSTDPFRLKRFGQVLDTPIGVAAGPHTQLAQNIIASWLCGARYIELKTIQTLDELGVSKPCIDMQDEGYNCEWSQELKIKESFDQYLNAWIIIHLLKHKFGWKGNELGAIFNMSVGYNLEGILKENVQWFFDKMTNCKAEKKAKIEEINEIYPAINKIFIPDLISDNITLSTMHGCPPDEIEKIGHYLISDKKLHTTIKLNPTLLGKKELHEILDFSGFKTQVPDLAFEHDLKYPDAIKIIKNLQQEASKRNVYFGLKLTNTLESLNHKNIFPKNEEMMYMSGKPLHPIAINLAYKLQKEFNGTLDISFSAGVNAFNISDTISCGLSPATVCSDILRPGGYGLLHQYIEKLRSALNKANSDTIDQYVLSKSGEKSKSKAILKNLEKYAAEVFSKNTYKKTTFGEPSIKTSRKLNSFDCIKAPCTETCPANQDIPDYLHYASMGESNKGFETILRTNPFPQSTGMVCDHICQTKCTRINYDDPLLIREIKRYISDKEANSEINFSTLPDNNKKVSIIGAGPSGLSCAFFLRLAGFDVSVYENKNHAGGMVSAAIPTFRLSKRDFEKDLQRIQKLGIKILHNQTLNNEVFNNISKTSDYVYIATGASRSRKFLIEGINSPGVLDPLEFLFNVKDNNQLSLGKNIIIIGGGNTAMDTARTAFRVAEKGTKITILYRRSIEQMPAGDEEIRACLEEGIEIIELVLPIKVNTVKNKISSLTCIRMRLEGKDSAGRPKPVEIPGSAFEIACDTLLPAIGQDPQIDFIDHHFLKSTTGKYETQFPNVFLGGDALRGASTMINAIGDGRKVANIIMEKAKLDFSNPLPKGRIKESPRKLMINRMKKIHSVSVLEMAISERKNFNQVTQTLSDIKVKEEALRCLKCDELCNTCVTVCPNFALYSYMVNPFKINLQKIIRSNGVNKITDNGYFSIEQEPQILHIADWCNECGNCNTFCPTADAPYKIKPHLYLYREAFENDDDCYNLVDETLLYRKNGKLVVLEEKENEYIYTQNKNKVHLDKINFSIIDSIINEPFKEIDLRLAAEMRIILSGANELTFGTQSKNQTKSLLKTEKYSPFTKGARGIYKTPYLSYNKNLKRFSRNLRNDSTLGEVLLWNELRAKQLGYTFNRQKPILNYIVDFFCKPLNLVIELDGDCHDNDDARRRDIKRQNELEDLGLIFLRFDDLEVKKDIDNVIREIKVKIKEIKVRGLA